MGRLAEEHKNYYKRTFGATFHKNMTPREIVNIWNTRVPASVKDCFPELVIAFGLLELALDAEIIAYRVYKTAKMLYDTIKEAIDLATAIITGQVQFPTAKAQKIGTELLLKVEVTLMKQATERVLPIILEKALQGRCQH